MPDQRPICFDLECVACETPVVSSYSAGHGSFTFGLGFSVDVFKEPLTIESAVLRENHAKDSGWLAWTVHPGHKENQAFHEDRYDEETNATSVPC